MNIRNISARAAAVAVLPMVVSAVADAQQTTNLTTIPGLAYKQTRRETWKTVAIISGVLLFAGLVDDNSALIIVGGAGLLISLSATNGSMYRPEARGMDLLQMGNVSLGVKPFQQFGQNLEFHDVKPNLTLQAKFKF